MGYIICLILFALGVLIKRKHGTWTCPSTLYCFFWTIITLLASLRLFDLNEVSWKAWIIILVGSISFVVGSEAKFAIGRKSLEECTSNVSYYLKKKTFWILFAVLAVLTIRDLKNSYDLMKAGYSLGLIRSASYGEIEIGGYIAKSDFVSVLLSTIRSSFQVILIAVGIEYFISDFKQNKKYLIAVLVVVVADAFSFGGRWGIAYFIVEFFVCYSIYSFRKDDFEQIVISKSSKGKVVIFGAILISLILVVTVVRGGSLQGSLSYFYAYICGCVPLFDLKLQELESTKITSLIFAGQYGVWSIIIPIFSKILGIGTPQLYSDTLTKVMTGQTYYNIGGGRTYNAFVSAFYYLYADMRIFGVIVGMMLFGVLAGTLYRSCTDSANKSSVVPYLIITQMIVKTVQNYPLSSRTYAVVFFIMVLIHFGRRIVIGGKSL